MSDLVKGIVARSDGYDFSRLGEVEYIFSLTYTHRPTDAILLERYGLSSLGDKGGLLDLVLLWDYLFEGKHSDSMSDNIEEWLEDMSFLREVLTKGVGIYLNCGDFLDSIPEGIRDKPLLGRIRGVHPRMHELNDLSEDLKFPELQGYLGRDIKVIGSDYDTFIKESNDMLGCYGGIYVKWLGVDKAYSVRKLSSSEDVVEYIQFDPYMFEHLYRHEIAIQEALDLGDEYRFFVVGGRVATWSLNRWDLTPLDANQALWSRGIHFDDIYKTVLEVIGCLSEGSSLVTQDYVIDMSWDSKYGRAVVVELNPIHNSGLYGIDLVSYVDSILEHSDGFRLRLV